MKKQILLTTLSAGIIGDTVHVTYENNTRIMDLGSHSVTTDDENISFFSTYQIEREHRA